MHTESPVSTGTPARRPSREAHRVPWTVHLLAAALYALGTCGMLGALPSSLNDVGLGLGVLILAIGWVIAARAQIRRHGRVFSAIAAGSPCSLLSAWAAGGPLLFQVLLPDATPLSVAVMLSLLLGTVFFTALRLEDGELTARAALNCAE